MKSNLIISYEPTHLAMAKNEVTTFFEKAKEKFKFLSSDTPGLFKVRTKDPKKTIKNLTKIFKKNKDLFQFTFKYIPIDTWTSTKVPDMQKAIKKYDKIIKENEKWKLSLNKRSFHYHSDNLIVKLTDPIKKTKVDLNKPDKIIRVEILGKEAGIALLDKDEFLVISK
jgi:tRNA(Ser,Leu) C12 N-acetylase TAN1